MPIPVLMYHLLDREKSAIAISPDIFAQQMRWLYDHQYQVMALSQVVDCLENKQPLPEHSVVLTFDDGFESVYTEAFPILAGYGFPATVFLVSGYCGQTNNWPNQPLDLPRHPLLNWTQIQEMHRYHIDFGAHTVHHPFLDRLKPAELEYEIVQSKAALEDQLGQTITLFAYPYGRYNETAKAVVRRSFRGACSTTLGLVTANSDPLELERIDAFYLTRPLFFGGLSKAWFSFYLGSRRLLRTTASRILNRPWQ